MTDSEVCVKCLKKIIATENKEESVKAEARQDAEPDHADHDQKSPFPKRFIQNTSETCSCSPNESRLDPGNEAEAGSKSKWRSEKQGIQPFASLNKNEHTSRYPITTQHLRAELAAHERMR